MEKYGVAPNPGSEAAIALGCICPVMDNGRGRGCGMVGENGEPLFYYTVGCPVHCPQEPKVTKN